MNLIKIDDLSAADLQIYQQRKDKAFEHNNSFIADSPKVVNLLLNTDIEIKSILATQAYYDEFKALLVHKDIPQLFLADKEVISQIVGHKIHHNVMMHGIRPRQIPLDDLGERIIMLDKITSSENIGSIARSAAALGVDSYLLPVQGPHPYGRRAMRVSMGHVSMLKTHLYDGISDTLRQLKQRGYKIFAAEVTPDSTALLDVKVPKKWVLLMGHEGNGIAEEVLAQCDETVSIEMQKGVKSFNVSVAASILMYQFTHNKV